ncbi:MAG TPA: outer membrane protein transport protein [Candidatus Polarisedimenticolaceae bacterium]|nr:outer membrane protein transport protein [Candidatus Polarisedimenticolaceae bacterium]
MSRRWTWILGGVLGWSVLPSHASGFSFSEQSAKASAQAGAWVARADDAAANWYNPAALVRLKSERGDLQVGLNYVDAGSDLTFTPAAGGPSIDAVSHTTEPFHLYFAQKLGSRLGWGIGINTPFGLITHWDQPPLTFSSRRAELRTYLFNPNVAFAINDAWSFALGLDYLWIDVRDLSRDVNLGPLGISTANVTGDGDAWGYDAGFLYRRERFSIAGTYRSDMRPEVDGRIELSGPAGALLDSPATAKPHLPDQFLLGAAYTQTRFDVELGAYYTQWNEFDELAIDTGTPLTSTTLREDWSATWAYRLGAAFRLSSADEARHEIRAGLLLEDSPVPEDTRRPSIPDSDRTGFSAGYGFQGKALGLDAYVMYLDFDDGVADGSVAEGVIDGVYTSSVLLLGATFKYRF